MNIRTFFIAAAVGLSAPAGALAGPVELTSEIFVERTETAADGSKSVALVPADRVVPGERLRFVIRFSNPSEEAASDFILTNPVPDSVAYLGAEGPVEPKVSVDGETYGALAELVVTEAEGGSRPAQASDVTHIRWAFGSVAPRSSGQVLYRGELR